MTKAEVDCKVNIVKVLKDLRDRVLSERRTVNQVLKSSGTKR